MALWTRCSSGGEEDDFFGAESDVVNTGAENERRSCVDGNHFDDGLAAREAIANKEKYRSLGYHETYDQSQEETLQQGFTSGYKNTFDVALRLGRQLGHAALQRTELRAGSSPADKNEVGYKAAASKIRTEVKLACEPSKSISIENQPTNQKLLDLELEVADLFWSTASTDNIIPRDNSITE